MSLCCRYPSGRKLFGVEDVEVYNDHTSVSNLRYALVAVIGADADLKKEGCGAGAEDLQEASAEWRKKKKRPFSAVEADEKADVEEVLKKMGCVFLRLFHGTQELHDDTKIKSLLTSASDIIEVLVVATWVLRPTIRTQAQCFINATITAVFSCPTIATKLRELNMLMATSQERELKETLHDATVEVREQTAYVPHLIWQRYYRGRQEDAHEFLQKLLDDKDYPTLNKLFRGSNYPRLYCAKAGCTWSRQVGGEENDFTALVLNVLWSSKLST